MIVIDFNHLVIEACSASMHKTRELNPAFVRHVFLKRLAGIVNHFKDDYGMPVICLEGKGYWRKDVFKEYKENRKDARDKSHFDWNTVYYLADMLAREIKSVLKYPVLQKLKFEADDIVASIALNFPEKHVIVSRDSDFFQLKRFGNVVQWDEINSEFKETDETANYLVCLTILKGAAKDGVPNIYSNNSALVDKISRQSPISTKLIEAFYNAIENPVETSIEEGSQIFFELAETQKTIEKKGLTIEDITNNYKRNHSTCVLGMKNEKIDNYVLEELDRDDFPMFDVMEFMDYCTENRLKDVVSEGQKFIWR